MKIIEQDKPETLTVDELHKRDSGASFVLKETGSLYRFVPGAKLEANVYKCIHIGQWTIFDVRWNSQCYPVELISLEYRKL